MRLCKKILISLLISAGFVLLPSSSYAASDNAELLQLRAEQWEITRHGDRLLNIPVLRNIVKTWSANVNHNIELQYPGGEEGELWVEELMDWMVSLGIPSANMIAVPGSGAEDIIRFKILRKGE